MKPVFMIGEQRSGSNLLRLMLDQSVSIHAPHPPHILTRFGPLVPTYGELEDSERFAALVDDVCRLVERNPTPWEVGGFEREDVARRCRDRSLIAVFGAIMDTAAERAGARSWVCKSMQSVRFAPEIERYFDSPRYIYLYRDGRDVALSFMKAVVGEKHPYFIAQRWAEIQRICLFHQLHIGLDRVHPVRYEDLVARPESVLRSLCEFLEIEFEPRMLDYHRSREAEKTAAQSSLWENLTKSVMRDNVQKFARQMEPEHVEIVESVAGDVLDVLGYERVRVPLGAERSFSDADIIRWAGENARLKQSLAASQDPGDLARRRHQLEVLAEARERAWS